MTPASGLVCFDLDGTLVDPWLGVRNCLEKTCRVFQLKMPDEPTLRGWIGFGMRESLASLEGLEDPARLEAALDFYWERYREDGVFEHELYPGIFHLLAPGASRMSDAGLRIVLTHELFHYASRADTAPDAPRWLTEGVADFVARPPTPVPTDALPVALTLPADGDLDQPGPGRSSGYDRAWWFARFVADTYGTSALKNLYLAACGAGHTEVPGAFRNVLGDDPAGVLARWRTWLTR